MGTAVANTYLESLLTGQLHLPASPLAWLNRLRAEAVDRIGALTVPTTRDEEWRFTDLSPLTKISLQPAPRCTQLQAAEIERYILPESAARLVFIDGIYAPELSVTESGKGIKVQNLAAATAHTAALEPQLGKHVAFHDNAFAALNTAFLHDGALIIVPQDTVLNQPLHLLFIATQSAAIYPRCLLLAGARSAVTVVEDYVAIADNAYLNDAVTEIVVADDARVEHVRVQREAASAFHIANCAVSLARASRYRSVSVTLGARLSRYNLNVTQHAEGAECTVDGLALIDGQQLADTHTCIDHARPHGVSQQLHKCIAGGASHAVFNGKILVRPGAQLTDSAQSSRNLLLSGRAHIDIKPQLEIFADDVKCAHGATVGQLDDEELFYLKSRGLSEEAARNLLTYAFGAEIIDRIPITSLRQRLEQVVQTTVQP
jgi:Fe-S cluster assembly protein SufD